MCYCVFYRPLDQRGGANVLILSPTRELAQQIQSEVIKYNYKGIKRYNRYLSFVMYVHNQFGEILQDGCYHTNITAARCTMNDMLFQNPVGFSFFDQLNVQIYHYISYNIISYYHASGHKSLYTLCYKNHYLPYINIFSDTRYI